MKRGAGSNHDNGEGEGTKRRRSARLQGQRLSNSIIVRDTAGTAVLAHAGPAYAAKKSPLTTAERAMVRARMVGGATTVVARNEGANIDLTRKHLDCLRPDEDLVDEVINYYFRLLAERALGDTSTQKMHFFNSFFAAMFEGGYDVDYEKVKRWSKRAPANIIDLDKVFIPVHVDASHWCLAVINFVDKRFECYDSRDEGNYEHADVLRSLRLYVLDEAETHSNQPDYDLSAWKDWVPGPADVPQQDNGHDCGVFVCKFADYLSHGLDLAFSAADMPLFRNRIRQQILSNNIDG